MMRVTFRVVAAAVAVVVAFAVDVAVALSAAVDVAVAVVAADSPPTPIEEEPNVIFLLVVAMARDSKLMGLLLGRDLGWHWDWDLDWGKA